MEGLGFESHLFNLFLYLKVFIRFCLGLFDFPRVSMGQT